MEALSIPARIISYKYGRQNFYYTIVTIKLAWQIQYGDQQTKYTAMTVRTSFVSFLWDYLRSSAGNVASVVGLQNCDSSVTVLHFWPLDLNRRTTRMQKTIVKIKGTKKPNTKEYKT